MLNEANGRYLGFFPEHFGQNWHLLISFNCQTTQDICLQTSKNLSKIFFDRFVPSYGLNISISIQLISSRFTLPFVY